MIKIPESIKIKKSEENKISEERIRYLELQIESLQSHPLIISSNYVIKQGKRAYRIGKSGVDKAFNCVKPYIEKLEPRANKVVYYGMLGLAQIFALLVAILAFKYLVWPVLSYIF